MKYRSDIDGLRAVAVLSIVIFHLDIGFLPGGYLGVDIFFVISGYLISKIIYSEMDKGVFSIANFYVRRIRRILPALFLVIIVSSAFAYARLYPIELVEYARSVVASIFFSANIYFNWKLSYFSPTADETPLLHLWSLGVEEQFYIIFPFVVSIIYKSKSKVLDISVIAMLLCSYIGSVWMRNSDPSAAFYLLPFRAYELLIGCVLSLQSVRPPTRKLFSAIALTVGLSFIGCAVFFFAPDTMFAGSASLLACLGAALVIYAGMSPYDISSRFLGNNLFATIGKISYSLYLFHWPVFVFGKQIFPHADRYIFALSAFCVSISLAYVNYKLIEQFFRHFKMEISPGKIFATTFAIAGTLFLTSCMTILKSGFPDVIDARITKVMTYLQYDPKPSYLARTCFLEPDQDSSTIDFSPCLPVGNGNTAILWGDSHAIQFFPGLKETMKAHGYELGVLTASACPPIIGIEVLARPKCREFTELSAEIILKIKPKILIMSASWVTNDSIMDDLEKTIKQLRGNGIKLVILGETPLYKQSVPKIIADRFKAGNFDMFSTNELEIEYLQNSENIMSKRFSNRDDVQYISVTKAVCPANRCPLITKDGVPVHFDIAHLTVSGSKLFSKELTPLILR